MIRNHFKIGIDLMPTWNEVLKKSPDEAYKPIREEIEKLKIKKVRNND